jgi:hypothetical protein
MEYTLRYFSHLRDSRFTFFHVIPPAPRVDWGDPLAVGRLGEGEGEAAKAQWMKEYGARVAEIAAEGKAGLLDAGVPEGKGTWPSKSSPRGRGWPGTFS